MAGINHHGRQRMLALQVREIETRTLAILTTSSITPILVEDLAMEAMTTDYAMMILVHLFAARGWIAGTGAHDQACGSNPDTWERVWLTDAGRAEADNRAGL